MSYRSNSLLMFIVMPVLIFASTVNAYELGPIKVHGYLSQAYINSDHYDFIGNETQDGSWEHREYGLSLFYRPTSRSYIATQISNRTSLDNNPNTNETPIDYLVIGFNIHSDYRNQLNLRIGDMRAEQGLYSTALNVPTNRDAVFLPQNLYDDAIRNSFYGVRGFDLTWTRQFKNGDLDVSLTAGLNRWDKSNYWGPTVFGVAAAPFGISLLDYQVNVAPSPYRQAKAQYVTADMGWKLLFIYRYYELSIESDYITNIGALKFVDTFEHDIRKIISIEREWQNWLLTFEYQNQHVKTSSALTMTDGSPIPGSPFPPATQGAGKTELWYLQSRYFFTSRWDAFVRYEKYIDAIPASDTRHTWVFGGGWKPYDGVKVRAEYYLNKGTGFKAAVDALGWDYHRYWRAFAFSVSYQF